MKFIYYLLLMASLIFSQSCSEAQVKTKNNNTKLMKNLETITLGAGCFWCVEAVFKDIIGVEEVTSGYINGYTKNPTYKEVCSGQTGHVEVLEIHFDTTAISLDEILDIFWYSHDPTTLNRQGNDVGTQYRSGIYYQTDEQRDKAMASLIEAQKMFDSKIVTEIKKAEQFYPAEDYHQDYFELNGTQPYCSVIIAPKVDKVKKKFKDKLKK